MPPAAHSSRLNLSYQVKPFCRRRGLRPEWRAASRLKHKQQRRRSAGPARLWPGDGADPGRRQPRPAQGISGATHWEGGHDRHLMEPFNSVALFVLIADARRGSDSARYDAGHLARRDPASEGHCRHYWRRTRYGGRNSRTVHRKCQSTDSVLAASILRSLRRFQTAKKRCWTSLMARWTGRMRRSLPT